MVKLFVSITLVVLCRKFWFCRYLLSFCLLIFFWVTAESDSSGHVELYPLPPFFCCCPIIFEREFRRGKGGGGQFHMSTVAVLGGEKTSISTIKYMLVKRKTETYCMINMLKIVKLYITFL